MIYRHLFKDQPIIIQGEDCYKPSSHGNWCVVSRDRAMGLNILLTCKSCLCEAKPVLLNTAKFDIYFGSIGSLESPQLQGFSRHELSMVRSVTLRRVNLWRGPVNMLLSIMKNLVKVTIFYGHLDFHYWRLERWISGSVITIPRAIRDIWKYDMHKMFLPHMKKKVETQADATLKLEYRAEFYDRTEAVSLRQYNQQHKLTLARSFMLTSWSSKSGSQRRTRGARFSWRHDQCQSLWRIWKPWRPLTNQQALREWKRSRDNDIWKRRAKNKIWTNVDFTHDIAEQKDHWIHSRIRAAVFICGMCGYGHRTPWDGAHRATIEDGIMIVVSQRLSHCSVIRLNTREL